MSQLYLIRYAYASANQYSTLWPPDRFMAHCQHLRSFELFHNLRRLPLSSGRFCCCWDQSLLSCGAAHRGVWTLNLVLALLDIISLHSVKQA
jgi:hypothetical protein